MQPKNMVQNFNFINVDNSAGERDQQLKGRIDSLEAENLEFKEQLSKVEADMATRLADCQQSLEAKETEVTEL